MERAWPAFNLARAARTKVKARYSFSLSRARTCSCSASTDSSASGPGQKLANPGQGQAQAFQREYLVQPGDLVRTVSPPAGLGPQRRQQAAPLIQAQRLDADPKAGRGLGGAEVHAGLSLSTRTTSGADPGDGASLIPRPHIDFSYK
jgi:hypothetical protein